MITGSQKNRVDALWNQFWTGGITNPLTVIEQISYLMFIRMLELRETRYEKAAQRKGQSHKGIYDGANDPRRWRNLIHMNGEQLVQVIDGQVFPQLRELNGSSSAFGQYMKNAALIVRKPSLLQKAVSMIDAFPLTQGDTKGDLYEYLLSKLTTAGF